MKRYINTMVNFFNEVVEMLGEEDPYMSHIPTNGSILFYERY